MIERTLCIVKPDAVKKGAIGEIVRRIEAAGLRVAAAKMLHISPETAGRFYIVHKDKGFYGSLTQFMSSGPVLAAVIEGENAIAKWRELMGATDPAKAAAGTIRRDFAANVEQNAVHGSDAPDTARWEIAFFFAQADIFEA